MIVSNDRISRSEHRPKGNVQDDPFDEHIVRVLTEGLGDDARCQKSSGPLISPDLVVYRPDACLTAPRSALRDDVSRIAAVEVKKLERARSGQVARSTGMDYNTTPPCGTARVYDAGDKSLDLRAFYLFVCQEQTDDSRTILTALALCDGDVLNADFQLYLEITGLRTKGLGLGTYGDGVNRNRPMLIFSNPLGAAQLDRAVTLVTKRDLEATETGSDLNLVYQIGRTVPEGGLGVFYAYRAPEDVSPDWEIQQLLDPFPKPVNRVAATQARGRFKLPIRPIDDAAAPADGIAPDLAGGQLPLSAIDQIVE